MWTRLEGTLGDSVLLKAQWEVFANDRSSLLKKESRISEQINGSSYDALIATMSGALERLSRDISGGIMSVLRQEPTKMIFPNERLLRVARRDQERLGGRPCLAWRRMYVRLSASHAES